MNDIQLAGPVEAALAHMSLVGAAAITESVAKRPVRVSWQESAVSTPLLNLEGTIETVAGAVLDHATAHAESGSWVMTDSAPGVWADARLFAARSKAPDASAWPQIYDQRAEARPPGRGTWGDLDEAFLAALGEPAWWRQDRFAKPDDGASRWEMKTRNRGEEFLRHRLGPLAAVVAGRSVEDIAAGLVGERVEDELGKNSTESRTGTGLAPPGPVDSAVAWCALWGLSALPVRRRLAAASGSAGMFPISRTSPDFAVLPVFTTPTTVSRYRAVVDSRKFVDCAVMPPGAARPTVEEVWLTEQGVSAIARFPVEHSSGNAPERTVMPGQVTRLWT